MSQIYNETAFPIRGAQSDEDLETRFGGMTLRDYFAAKAMQAMLINDKCTKALDQVAREQSRTFDDTLASSSYLIADAMLKERAK